MEIRRILDEKTWERFVLAQAPHTPFLQSWGWGIFQDALGLSIHRLGLFSKDKLVGGAQAITGERRLGRFMYVPHGPIFRPRPDGRDHGGQAALILEHLKKVAREEGADYLRVEPAWESNDVCEEALRQAGFRSANVPSQAGGTTLLLDLHPSEEGLLMGMRKTTRYLVKKAMDLGVEVRRSRDPGKMAAFHRLMSETYRRHGYKQDVLAAAIIIAYGDTASYLNGASVRGNVPASYLIQWEAIKQAKKAKLDLYDFWGIAPTDDPRHPWHGYSLFKKGFGGYRFDYTGAWDFPVTPRYWAVAGKEWLWKKRRHL
jgi:lipid II:glycine glycyltransferase (peptidoglycan interpeptide bridge formation enzyme)